MKLTEHLYKFTGVEYETNSNIYGIRYDEGIALIDVGYSDQQWNRMSRCMGDWGLSVSMVKDVFITHAHFDHAGNAWRFSEQGTKVHASEESAKLIERGNPEMERLFGSSWTCSKVDGLLRDGDVCDLMGTASIRVIATPGHSAGSLTFLVHVDGIVAAMTGDMLFITPQAPEDAVGVELGYAGGSDYSQEALVGSFERLSDEHIDLLCPGHYYTYRGEHMAEILDSACRQARRSGEARR